MRVMGAPRLCTWVNPQAPSLLSSGYSPTTQEGVGLKTKGREIFDVTLY